jgi:hypothetical protein
MNPNINDFPKNTKSIYNATAKLKGTLMMLGSEV